MLGKLKSLDARLLRRRCVGCGYDGALLRGGAARQCPRCGCDLRRRPARSYAEMEGLLGPAYLLDRVKQPRKPPTPRPAPRLMYRWLGFAFGGLLLLISIIYLSAAVWPG